VSPTASPSLSLPLPNRMMSSRHWSRTAWRAVRASLQDGPGGPVWALAEGQEPGQSGDDPGAGAFRAAWNNDLAGPLRLFTPPCAYCSTLRRLPRRSVRRAAKLGRIALPIGCELEERLGDDNLVSLCLQRRRQRCRGVTSSADQSGNRALIHVEQPGHGRLGFAGVDAAQPRGSAARWRGRWWRRRSSPHCR
jgi:hypothetical protein